MKFSTFITSLVLLLLTTVVSVASISSAGNLTPDATPGGTFRTLTDIFQRLTNSAYTPAPVAPFTSPTNTPAPTQQTLTQIYDLIPTIEASTIKIGETFLGVMGTYPSADTPLDGDTVATDATASTTCAEKEAWSKEGTVFAGNLTPLFNASFSINLVGTTYCGVEGTVFKDLFDGTGTSVAGTNYTGGSLGSGGVDDHATGGIPTDRYETPWTQCDVGNNYCGTGLVGADAKDEGTGLVWSAPCHGTGCSSLSEIGTATKYNWNGTETNNGGLSAVQLCSNGLHGQSGWILPSQKEIIQGYINGMYGNLDSVGSSGMHLYSATTYSDRADKAWVLTADEGHVWIDYKESGDNEIRCVKRPS